MKKRIISIISVIIATFVSLFAVGCTGCAGCAGDTSIMFNNNFLSGGSATDAQVGYKEVLTYDVAFKESYSDIQKNLNTNEYFNYNFSNGSYKMTFSSLATLPDGVDVQFNLGDGSSNYYYLKTEFNIDAWYKVPGEYADGGIDLNGGKLYKDSIVSEVYFLTSGNSFAPIKATTMQKQSSLYISSTPSVNYQTCQFTTVYKAGTYTTTTTYNNATNQTTSNYSVKSAIDNTQLLFALRNISVDLDGTFILPTVSPAYSSPQELAVKNKSEETLSKSILGLGDNLEIPVSNYMIYRNADKNTGCPQYAKVQKSSPNTKSLLIEYTASLMPCDTPFAFMGALVYTLTSVSYN